MSRFDYIEYDREAFELQSEVKEVAIKFESLINRIVGGGASRPTSIALTKLEEVYMWCGKAIRDQQIIRNGSAPLQEQRNNG